MDNAALIRRIEVRLKELGKTKGEFYKGTGVSSASYSQWNTGEFSPSKRKLDAIAEYLQVSVSYLLTGQESEKAPTAEGERHIDDEDIKFALFGGGGEITDAMYEEVKRFARMVRLREEAEKRKE